MNVIFFGSSYYCIPVLKSLNNNFDLTAVITKSNQPVCDFARNNNVRVLTPETAKELLNLKTNLENYKPDLSVVADYGLIIPEEIINIPKLKTINIHFSRLPDLRGASPVQFTILRGDKSAWITYMLMDKGLDTGNILSQSHIQGHPFDVQGVPLVMASETAESLYTKLFQKASREIPEVIKNYTSGKIKPVNQNDSKATYTRILKRDDGYIPWESIAKAMNGENSSLPKESVLSSLLNGYIVILLIERAIRAFSPWPNIWTKINIKNGEKRLKILKAHLENNKLILDKVQLEGKKPVSWKQFKEGYFI